jgi:hypothetical protein
MMDQKYPLADLEDFNRKWAWKLEGCDIQRVYEMYVAMSIVDMDRRISANPGSGRCICWSGQSRSPRGCAEEAGISS